MASWVRKSLEQAAQALAAKEVTSIALTQACIAQIRATRGLNMFCHETFETALEAAAASDTRRGNGTSLGKLDGIPVAFKDNFCTANVPTSAGSKILAGFTPCYESTATARLLNAGAIPMGKLNMDEFGMGNATVNSIHGPTINPWSPSHGRADVVSGGSSGASAAAVATGCVFASLGTDTGGSVRQPAAFCGVVGLKPNYGRVSRHGVIAYASSLDTPGILAKTITDAGMVLEVVSGQDPLDSTSVATESFRRTLPSSSALDLTGVKVGIPAEYHVAEMPADMIDRWQQGLAWLVDAGATPVQVSLPTTAMALSAYYVIACAEASSNLSRYDGVRYGHRAETVLAYQGLDESDALHDLYCRTRSEGFGEEVTRRILSGTFVLSASAFEDYYAQALLVRQAICEDFQRVFHSVDILLTPTTPTGPFSLDSATQCENPVEMYLHDVMTLPASLAGLPALSVPVSLMTSTSSSTGDQEDIERDHVLPMGLQLIAPPMAEDRLLTIGQVLEHRSGFRTQIPDSVYQPRGGC